MAVQTVTRVTTTAGGLKLAVAVAVKRNGD